VSLWLKKLNFEPPYSYLKPLLYLEAALPTRLRDGNLKSGKWTHQGTKTQRWKDQCSAIDVTCCV